MSFLDDRESLREHRILEQVEVLWGEVGEQPRVSVIVPTRDRPELLRRALQSVANQSYRELEVIIINDGGQPIDAAVESVGFGSTNVALKTVTLPRRQGLSAARNAGLQLAEGSLCSYLDDDDRWQPHFLETLVPFFSHRETQLVYTDYERVLEERDPETGNYRELKRSAVQTPSFDRRALRQSNLFPVNSLLHRRGLYERHGGFDEWLTALEDWDLWLRFSRESAFLHVPAFGPEVGRVAGVPTMTERQRFGFVWPSLNILYKLLLEAVTDPEWTDELRQGTDRAVENLIAHVATGVVHPAEFEWDVLFSFHTPALVANRLRWLSGQYSRNQHRFALLEALIWLVAEERSSVVDALRYGLVFRPDDDDLNALRARLE